MGLFQKKLFVFYYEMFNFPPNGSREKAERNAASVQIR